MYICVCVGVGVGDFIGSLPARGRPIRECLSIGIRNLAAFPRSVEGKSESEAEGKSERETERKRGAERDREKATRGRCGSIAFTECRL